VALVVAVDQAQFRCRGAVPPGRPNLPMAGTGGTGSEPATTGVLSRASARDGERRPRRTVCARLRGEAKNSVQLKGNYIRPGHSLGLVVSAEMNALVRDPLAVEYATLVEPGR
jgi:hypothetical protein